MGYCLSKISSSPYLGTGLNQAWEAIGSGGEIVGRTVDAASGAAAFAAHMSSGQTSLRAQKTATALGDVSSAVNLVRLAAGIESLVTGKLFWKQGDKEAKLKSATEIGIGVTVLAARTTNAVSWAANRGLKVRNQTRVGKLATASWLPVLTLCFADSAIKLNNEKETRKQVSYVANMTCNVLDGLNVVVHLVPKSSPKFKIAQLVINMVAEFANLVNESR